MGGGVVESSVPAHPVPRLVDRRPVVPREHLLAALTPPPRFDGVRFSTYRPDPTHPSQAEALAACEAFAAAGAGSRAGSAGAGHRRLRLLRRGPATPAGSAGIYLDGGFGVGKTHLLASLWHASPGPKAYGTFVELTSLVGVLGFAGTVEALAPMRLLAIDEFELDDPGDTVLVSTLLSRLVEQGVRLAATSNTQPEDLGAGRFAADDFVREIQGLSAHFTIASLDGPDFRQRGGLAVPEPLDAGALEQLAARTPGSTLDEFGALTEHLASLHPSRYGALVEDVALVCLRDVAPITAQDVALRFVVFADRVYDRDVPVAASGARLDSLFPAELMSGPYRKKYSRAVSRLGALGREAAALQSQAGPDRS